MTEPTPTATEPPAGAPKIALRLAALVTAALPFAYFVQKFRFLTDDGYITFRYSKHLAEGHGLVYNLGAEPPVEGYSEFLWAVLLALGIRLGQPPETFSLALSIGAGAILILLMVSLLIRWIGNRPIALLGSAALVGSAPPLAVWSTGGMATMPAAMLGLLLFWLLDRQAKRAEARRGQIAGDENPGERGASVAGPALLMGVTASILALMRADAALVVALILGPAFLAGCLQRDRLIWKPALVAIVLSTATFAAHVAWRYGVYGDWVPNTARVKLGFTAPALGRGLDYVLSNACTMPGLAAAFVGALFGAGLSARRIGFAPAAALAAMVLGVPAYAVTTGGDFMAFARFLVPAIPLAVLGFGYLIGRIERRSRLLSLALMLAAVGTSIVGAYGVHLVPESTRNELVFRHNQTAKQVVMTDSELAQWRDMKTRAEDWAVAGRALQEHVSPEESLVAGAIGAIGYYSGLFIYDRNGLVTREVAMREPGDVLRSPGHDKVVSRNYFFKYRPTYINAGICEESAWPPARGAVKLGPTERPGTVVWLVRGPKH